MVCMTGFFSEKFERESHFPPLPRLGQSVSCAASAVEK